MAVNYCSGTALKLMHSASTKCNLIIVFQNYLILWVIFNSCFLIYIENISISFSLQKSLLMAKGIYDLKGDVAEI